MRFHRETAESSGVSAPVPHLIVGVEFTPEGGRGPVAAVDHVDAASVDLKEDDPRRALLLDAAAPGRG